MRQSEHRRRQVREASRRYQQTPAGRLNHANRQREYRKRKAAEALMKAACAPAESRVLSHDSCRGTPVDPDPDLTSGSHGTCTNPPPHPNLTRAREGRERTHLTPTPPERLRSVEEEKGWVGCSRAGPDRLAELDRLFADLAFARRIA